MFDIGFTELLVCAIIALLVLGPERLPGAVRTVGRWIGRARHTVNHFTDQIDREIRAEELKRRIEEEMKKSGVDDVARQVKQALHAPLPLIGADHLRHDAAGENRIAPPGTHEDAAPIPQPTAANPVSTPSPSAPVAEATAPAEATPVGADTRPDRDTHGTS